MALRALEFGKCYAGSGAEGEAKWVIESGSTMGLRGLNDRNALRNREHAQ